MASIWLTWKLLCFEEHHQESKNQPRKQEKIQIIYDKALVSRMYKTHNTNNRGTNCSNKNFYEEAHDMMTNIKSFWKFKPKATLCPLHESKSRCMIHIGEDAERSKPLERLLVRL